ncbi:MAG: helix-turn-helix domain-containing protein [Anaerolineales bacterium]|jgi:transcriptional regulator with XRE-family HTH domain
MGIEELPHQNIGQKIRELRIAKNFSLRDLSERCGLSINAISRIERGENSPTVKSLQRLADGLDIAVVSLFELPRQCSVVYTSGSNTIRNQLTGVLVENLAYGLLNQQVEPLRVTSDPQFGIDEETFIHYGQEFVYCITGYIEYCIDNELYFLNPGDSLMFDAGLKHSWKNVGEGQAVQLILLMSIETDTKRRHYSQITISQRES